MPKMCRFNLHIRCFWFRCDFVDFKGDVRVCGHHPNKAGLVTPRRVSLSVLRGVSH